MKKKKETLSVSFKIQAGVHATMKSVAQTMRISITELSANIFQAFCAHVERKTSAVSGLVFEKIGGRPMDGLSYVVKQVDGDAPVAKFASPQDAALFIAASLFKTRAAESPEEVRHQ